MMEIAVQLLHLVQSMKVTVTVTLNAKETLHVGQTIVLHLFHLQQIVVNTLENIMVLIDVRHVCIQSNRQSKK